MFNRPNRQLSPQEDILYELLQRVEVDAKPTACILTSDCGENFPWYDPLPTMSGTSGFTITDISNTYAETTTFGQYTLRDYIGSSTQRAFAMYFKGTPYRGQLAIPWKFVYDLDGYTGANDFIMGTNFGLGIYKISNSNIFVCNNISGPFSGDKYIMHDNANCLRGWNVFNSDNVTLYGITNYQIDTMSGAYSSAHILNTVYYLPDSCSVQYWFDPGAPVLKTQASTSANYLRPEIVLPDHALDKSIAGQNSKPIHSYCYDQDQNKHILHMAINANDIGTWGISYPSILV